MTCTVMGCQRLAVCRGWCNPHYQSWYRHGDPSRGSLRPGPMPTCSVDGCKRYVRSDHGSYCRLHGERHRLHGDVSHARQGGKKWPNSDGYVLLYKPNHPLANKQGKVYEHRLVLWEKTAGCDQDCYWCGGRIQWFGRGKGQLVTDHLDGHVANNAPSNLVAACGDCNQRRGYKPKQTCVRGHAYTEDNTYLGSRGRECRVCRRGASARHRQGRERA